MKFQTLDIFCRTGKARSIEQAFLEEKLAVFQLNVDFLYIKAPIKRHKDKIRKEGVSSARTVPRNTLLCAITSATGGLNM